MNKHEQLLYEALRSRGVPVLKQYPLPGKIVDFFIPDLNLILEVDGAPHFVDISKWQSDFKRDHYSFAQGYLTKRIPNEWIDMNLDAVADTVYDLWHRYKGRDLLEV